VKRKYNSHRDANDGPNKPIYIMAIEMSRQKHLIHSRRDRSYSMIGCNLDDSGNLINGRKLDRRFLSGIDTRRWETILPKSPLAASSTFFFFLWISFRLIGMWMRELENKSSNFISILNMA
jgi:hypothetical protein